MPDSFETVLTQHQGLLSRVASSYEHNEAMQQELLQEIAVAVWQALPRFKNDASIKTYILKIAHNRCVTHVITQTRQVKIDDYQDNPDIHTTDDIDNPENNSHRQQQIFSLLEAVRTLPVKTRQIVTLALEGLSYQEIHEVSGMNINQIGVTLNRAKTKLKGLMEDE